MDGVEVNLAAALTAGAGGDGVHVAEDAVVEGGLVLVDGAARAEGGVGPVHLVGLADLHAGVAVLPLVRLGELGVVGVVEVAAAAEAGGAGEELAVMVVRVVAGALAVLVELARGPVLGAEVPVHVDGAETLLEVGLGDQVGAGRSPATLLVRGVGGAGHGDITASLLHGVRHALGVVERGSGGLGLVAEVLDAEDAARLARGRHHARGLAEVGNLLVDGGGEAEGGDASGAARGDPDTEEDRGLGGHRGRGGDLGGDFDDGGHDGGESS